MDGVKNTIETLFEAEGELEVKANARLTTGFDFIGSISVQTTSS
jgi:hypothetical protein